MIAAKRQFSIFDFNPEYVGGDKPRMVNPITKVLGLGDYPEKDIKTSSKLFDIKPIVNESGSYKKKRKRRDFGRSSEELSNLPGFIQEFHMMHMLQSIRRLLESGSRDSDSNERSKIKIEINI